MSLNNELIEEEEQELAEEYVQGGYHLVQIGDIFCGNAYRVVRKLGWGAFSTVWLCLNLKSETYCAIKVVKSKKCFRESAKEEIGILSDIRSAQSNDPFGARVVTLLDFFTIRGINGKHNCLVFEVMGDSLFRFQTVYYKRGIPIDGLKVIVRQVFEGLEYLHSYCGLIHTDIKPENICLAISEENIKRMHLEVENMIDSESQLPNSFVSMTKTYRRQTSDRNKNRDKSCDQNRTKSNLNGDQLFTRNFSFGAINENWSEISLKIVDLGNACYVGQTHSSTIQTRPYRSPEAIVGSGYGTSADIWSTACLAFELATGELLFDPHSSAKYSRSEEHLAKIIQMLGPIPKSCQKGKHFRYLFYKSGRLFNIKVLKRYSIEDLLVEQHHWSRTEAHSFAQFLLPMLSIDCRKRPTAYQCLTHPWLNRT